MMNGSGIDSCEKRDCYYYEESGINESDGTCNYYFKIEYDPWDNCPYYISKSEVNRIVDKFLGWVEQEVIK